MMNQGKHVHISMRWIWLSLLLVVGPAIYLFAVSSADNTLKKILSIVAVLLVFCGLFLWRRVTKCPACGSNASGRVMTFSNKPVDCPACRATIHKKF